MTYYISSIEQKVIIGLQRKPLFPIEIKNDFPAHFYYVKLVAYLTGITW